MRWTERIRHLGTVGILLLALGACTEVRYQAEGADAPESTGYERTVLYKTERAFYDAPPRCVVLLPLKTSLKDGRQIRMVERAVARHLANRFDRVIGPDRRDRRLRALALDLSTASGRRSFAKATRCEAVVDAVTGGFETTFLLVWAQAKFGLTLTLARAADDIQLWRASHTASRSEGTLPTSPFSLPVGAFSAGRFHGDGEIFPSMVDDVARRLMASLPDTRGLMAERRRPR